MKFARSDVDVFIPVPPPPPSIPGIDANSGSAASLTVEAALARTTHLCVATHQDDIEIMAYPGIAECFGRDDRWFSGVVVTNGAGSPRTGLYGDFDDARMQSVRRHEQRKAAFVGDYSVQVQLAHPSAAVKDRGNADVHGDLVKIFETASALEVVYLHQPADKHDTHIAVLAHSLRALRALPAEKRPKRVLGCEVWRDLDWMLDADKQVLDAGRYPNVAAALVGVFDSQISGGKRYDLATAGRRLAHATYHTSHATDAFEGITWAMDLTPLVADASLDVAAYAQAYIERFAADVRGRLAKFF
ncbi:PIG-L deacetylase family protein [Geminisphaera colitermitum]|uniref:PIG-L deacetylase family protein n=1 Tax=Geminisphaera colitermitum TaxID=1148786 RepID=UPI00019655D9|nr:PIG-L family deacetylase [Geminisphaera colitermitum]